MTKVVSLLRSRLKHVTLAGAGLAIALATAVTPTSAQVLDDVVYLKNGSIVRGTIVEQMPGESILVQTKDGNTWRFTMEEVARMTREAPAVASTPAASSAVSPRNPTAAGALSFLLAGGGQFYNGESDKGLIHLGGMLLSLAIALSGSEDCMYYDSCSSYYAGLLGAATIGIYSIVDAVQSARRINAASGFAIELAPRLERVPNGPRWALDHRTTRLGLQGRVTW